MFLTGDYCFDTSPNIVQMIKLLLLESVQARAVYPFQPQRCLSSATSSSMFLLLMKSVTWFFHDCGQSSSYPPAVRCALVNLLRPTTLFLSTISIPFFEFCLQPKQLLCRKILTCQRPQKKKTLITNYLIFQVGGEPLVQQPTIQQKNFTLDKQTKH